MENVQKTQLGISIYYKNLKRNERRDLISYLIKRYDMNYYTLIAKFNRRNKMSMVEIEVIANVINEEAWRI